jgi:hypothetical protein
VRNCSLAFISWYFRQGNYYNSHTLFQALLLSCTCRSDGKRLLLLPPPPHVLNHPVSEPQSGVNIIVSLGCYVIREVGKINRIGPKFNKRYNFRLWSSGLRLLEGRVRFQSVFIKAALAQIFFPSASISPCQQHSIIAPYSSVHLPPKLNDLRNV